MDGGNLYTLAGSYSQGASLVTAPLSDPGKAQALTGNLPIFATAASDGTVFWIEGDGGDRFAIRSIPASGGGSPTTLASGLRDPVGVAADEDSVYWVDELAGTVVKMPRAGGRATVIASGQASPDAIAVDDQFVYWANAGRSDDANGIVPGTGSIVRAPK